MTALLIVLAVGFAWSIGAHYTGAVMGMPHALRAIGAWQALLLMAPLALVGATFASHAVEKRVGSGLTAGALSVRQQVVVIGVAFAVTTSFNRFRMPTSTIQILVFSIVGVALATDAGVRWSSIGHLVGVWAAAPVAAIALGLLLTLLLDRLPVGAWIGAALVAMGAVAAFAMGANDVSNASGALVGTGTLSPLEAGAVGGAGIGAGPTPANDHDTLRTFKAKATYYHDRKYGATLAWILFIVLSIFTYVQFRASRSWVFYAGEGRDG